MVKLYNMRHVIIAMVYCFLSNFSFASGYWGSYLLKGTAIEDGQILCSKELTVSIGKKDTIITTDEHGNYEIKINWSTFHSVGSSLKDAEKLNPEEIIFIYNKKKMRVKNNWQLSQQVLLAPDKTFDGVNKILYSEEHQPMLFGDYSPSDYPNIYILQELNF